MFVIKLSVITDAFREPLKYNTTHNNNMPPITTCVDDVYKIIHVIK